MAVHGSRQRVVWRYLALVVGLVLLGAALWYALREIDWRVLRAAQPRHVGLIALGVVGNLVITGLLYWAVTRVFPSSRPLRAGTSIELTAASHLLNYLPLRAGMVGRAAYLKVTHGLALRHSFYILAVVMVVTVLVAGLVLVAAPLGAIVRSAVGAAVLAVLALASGPIVRWVLRRPAAGAWMWLPLRGIDVLFTALRLWAAMQIVQHPIALETAIIIGAVGNLVGLLGLTPNGLGLREWCVAITAQLLEPGKLEAAGLAAGIDRAIEAIVVVLLGLAAIRHLGMRDIKRSETS